MRDPYLYDDVNVLKNLANIKDAKLLARSEADITNVIMTGLYNQKYYSFDVNTLKDIHKTIFGQIYEWAGEYRTIQIIKREEVLGGDTVNYAQPEKIDKKLKELFIEIKKLKRDGKNDKEIIFKLVRIISAIWHIHPFREGNTRTVIVFAVLYAKSLGYEVNYELFKEHSAYVRNALVWCTQGMYSKYEYLEDIFYDAILNGQEKLSSSDKNTSNKYEMIDGYKVKDYKEVPHEYIEEK